MKIEFSLVASQTISQLLSHKSVLAHSGKVPYAHFLFYFNIENMH